MYGPQTPCLFQCAPRYPYPEEQQLGIWKPRARKSGLHVPGSIRKLARPSSFSLKSSINTPNPQVPKQQESWVCLFFTCPPGSEDGPPPHPPLKRSRSASSKSRTSRPLPPPGGSSWSVDSVGDPRLLVPPASPLRSRSRLSPVTNAESTASEGARPHQTLRPDPGSPHDASARLPGCTGPTKWPTPGALQRPSPGTPSRASPSPPPPPTSRGLGSPLTCS